MKIKRINAIFLVICMLISYTVTYASEGFSGYTQSFDEFSEGVFSSTGWKSVKGSNSVVKKDDRSMVRLGDDGTIGRILWYPTAIKESFWTEVVFMQDEIVDIYSIVDAGEDPWSTKDYAFCIGAEGGNIVFRKSASEGDVLKLSEYEAGEFYRISVFCDMENKTNDIYIDGNIVAEDIDFWGDDISSVDRFNFQEKNTGGDLYIDHFAVLPNVSKAQLEQKITEAQSYADSVEIGNLKGNCSAKDKEAFLLKIEEAKNANATITEAVTDIYAVYDAVKALDAAVSEFEAAILTKDIDISELKDVIDRAEQMILDASIGDAMGQKPQEAADALQEEINQAQDLYEQIQAGADAALMKQMISELEAAMSEFENITNKEYKTLFADDFETLESGDGSSAFKSKWTTIVGNVTAESVGNSMRACIYTEGANGNSRLVKNFSTGSLSGASVVELSFMIGQKTDIFQIAEFMSEPVDASGLLFELSSDGNNVYLNYAEKESIINGYEEGVWYKLRAEIDVNNQSFKLYVNDTAVLGGKELSFSGDKVTSLDRINFRVISSEEFEGNKKLYIDDVKVYASITDEYKAIADELKNSIGSEVYKNITLPTEYDGASVSWESSDSTLISADGVVSRPVDSDKICSLTMHISKYSYEYIEKISVTVPKISYEAAITEDFENISELPDGWRSDSAEVKTEGENKYLSAADAVEIEVSGKNIYPSAAVDFDFTAEGSGNVFELKNSEDSMILVEYDGENIITGGQKAACEANSSHKLSVIIDTKNNKYNVLLDSLTVASNIEFGGNTENTTIVLGGSGLKLDVDNINAEIQKPVTISFVNGADKLLKANLNAISEEYSIKAEDAQGREIPSFEKVWMVTPQNAGVTVDDGILSVAADASEGEYILTVALPEKSVMAEKTILIEGQTLKSINIIGKDSIKSAGSYSYTVQGISIYDTVVPISDAVWSFTGNAASFKDGVLKVGSGVSGTVRITVSLNGISGYKDIKISTGSSGGSGGGGSSSAVSPYYPTTVNEVKNENNSSVFSDLDSVSWAKDAITSLYEKGIINGVDSKHFNPNDCVTREQFVKMLVDTLEIAGDTDSKLEFLDVEAGRWSEEHVKRAYSAGIVEGYDNGNFGVEDKITRQDTAVMLLRALKYKDIEMNEGEVDFEDADKIAYYAKEAVGMLSAMGIINGRDGGFFPQDYATRAEAAVIIQRTLDAVENR